MTTVDATGTPSKPGVKTLVDVFTGGPGASSAGIDTVALAANHGLVPNCAMTVQRGAEGGNLSATAPSSPCGCAYEASVGKAPAACVACTDDTTCTGGSHCSYGYCETDDGRTSLADCTAPGADHASLINAKCTGRTTSPKRPAPTVPEDRTRFETRLSGFVQADAVPYAQSSEDQVTPVTNEPLNQQRFLIRHARLRLLTRQGPWLGTLEIDGTTVKSPSVGLLGAEVSFLLSRTPPVANNWSRAFFLGLLDLGARVQARWGTLVAQVAVMNGEPLAQGRFTGRDPNAAKDIIGRLGLALQRWRLRLDAGVSALTGKGFHPGNIATKDVLVWRDQNEDGIVQISEISEQRALVPLPAYRDFLAKTSVEIDEDSNLTVEALGAWDSRRLDLPASSFVEALSDERRRDFTRAAVRYLTACQSESTTALLWVGRDHFRLGQQLGLVPVATEQTSRRAGLRLARSLSAGVQRLEWGIDGLLEVSAQSRQGSLTNPPREGDLAVFGVPPAVAAGQDSWHPVLANLAPYVSGEPRWGRWEFRPGLRVDGFFVSSDRILPPTGNTPRVGFSRADGYLSPRASTNLAATSWLILGASAGIQRRAPDAADLSPVFGSPWLGAARARVGTVSATFVHRLATGEISTFARRLDGLAVRNADPWPGLAHSLVSKGRGRANGVSVSFRHDCPSPGVCAYLSDTLSRAERRGPADADWRLLDLDQTHLLSTSLGYRGHVWFAGGRLRYATGRPRIPVTGAYFDSNAGRYRPILGVQNSQRLPDFIEIDLRLERSWRWPRLALTAGIEALNPTN